QQGFEGAEQDTSGFAFGFAGDVETVVIAVDEVDVGVAGKSEEDGVAGRLAGGGVGGGIVDTEIGFNLDDAGGEIEAGSLADQDFAEEVAGYTARVTGEECAGERAGGVGWGRGFGHGG